VPLVNLKFVGTKKYRTPHSQTQNFGDFFLAKKKVIPSVARWVGCRTFLEKMSLLISRAVEFFYQIFTKSSPEYSEVRPFSTPPIFHPP